MINAGINVVTVSKRLGHASVSMTLNRYGHLVDGSQRLAADAFAEAMNGARMVPMVPAKAKEIVSQVSPLEEGYPAVRILQCESVG